MQGRRRWPWVVSVVVVVVLAAVAGGVLWQRSQQRALDRGARDLATRTAAALAAGDVSGLPLAGTTGAAAQTARAKAVKGIGATPSVTAGAVTRSGDAASTALAVRWPLGGGATWAYSLPLRLTHGSGWQVAAGQQLVAPGVQAGDTISVRRTSSARADVTGAGGAVIVQPRDVVDVGVEPSRMTASAKATATRVAAVVDVAAGPLASRISAASANAFVPVITLRRSDYDAVRSRLHPIPGVVLTERQQPLAPTREFARALLGSVGAVTAEQVQQSKGRYRAGDVAGTSGLQAQYDAQLAGTPGTTVELHRGDADPQPLHTVAAKAGRPLHLTLDTHVQEAADAALADVSSPAALVAVDVRTGAVLAVANSPASGLDRALVGRYEPGSTFKVVTTLSLLRKGLRPSDSVPCPATATVGGRSFKNFEAETFGAVPFRTDFAKSCNTAFVGLSQRLGADDLKHTAATLGLGTEYPDLGTSAFAGSIPSTTSAVDRAAASFGQGRNLVSPLAVTVATAAVARGAYLPPTLVDTGAAAPAPEPLPQGDVATLQGLMRDVVTSGTGTALRGLPGGAVHAKTGTAEFGTASPPKTHAWITGWQGDVAFTAFVEEGSSGGTVAGPVAARLLRALH